MPMSFVHLHSNFLHFLDLRHTNLNEPSISKWYRACEQAKSKSKQNQVTSYFYYVEILKKFYTDISQSRKGVTTTLYWFLTRQKYTTTFHCWTRIQANKYLLKSRIETLKNGVEKLTVKNLELYHWLRSCVFVVSFEYITYIVFQYIFFICWDLQIRFLFIKSVLLFFNRSLVRSYSHFKRIVTIKNVFFLYTFNKLWS